MSGHDDQDAGSAGRVYLAVPFAERGEAKRLGARWDGAARRWYAPAGLQLSQFMRWSGVNAPADPAAAFAAALSDAGLLLDGPPIMDGALHRVRVKGDRAGARSGAYIGHLDHRPAGFIQNFRTGEKCNWKAETDVTLSPEERARLARAFAAEKESREQRRERVHNETRLILECLIAQLPFAGRGHPYLQRKGVDAHGALLNTIGPIVIPGGRETPQSWSAKGDLILPIRDQDGRLQSAQTIDRNGRKIFPRGGRVTGGVHLIGDRRVRGLLVIAEGYATAATIHELTGHAVAVAFNAGNLEPAARAFREGHPDLAILVAGDNDHRKARERLPDGRPKVNAGQEAAEKAANAVGGLALLPRFGADDRGTDWNDLAAKGNRAFFEQWDQTMQNAEKCLELRRSAGRAR
jgi:phage/plasmid primase-like uncharacterized protein